MNRGYRREPRRQLYGKRFDGAREIDRILRETNTSVSDFCVANALDRWVLERLLNGRAQRPPDAQLVMLLEKATVGRVTLPMWATSTLRDDLDGEVIPAAKPTGT